jgi:hypothetical protein
VEIWQDRRTVNPFKAIESFVALVEKAGVLVDRVEPEGELTVTGTCRDHESLLDAFCAVARMPVDREVDRYGEVAVVADDQDADLLLTRAVW